MANSSRSSNHTTLGAQFALSRAEVMGTTVTFARLLSLLLPLFTALVQKARVRTCQDNLRQFANAVLL